MERADIIEFHNITPIDNLASILERGILSNKLAKQLPHSSLASAQIQTRRSSKIVPGGEPLHTYVNLYFHARNPMLFQRKDQHGSICVLRISPQVLDLPGVVITNQNASSDYVRFFPSPDGLTYLDQSLVFAESWKHIDQIEEWRHKSIKCAEILIPERVELGYIIGTNVSSIESQSKVKEICSPINHTIEVTVNEHLFFRS